MDNKQTDWLVGSAAVMIIAGFVLSISHGCIGWFLIFLGTVYLCGLTATGRKWIAENPDYYRYGLFGGILLFLVLVIGVII